MTITKSQTDIQLSPKEIIEAINQLSITDRRTVWAAFNLFDDDVQLEPMPYVIALRDDAAIDDQLDEIWCNRPDIATKMDIQESIEELLESLST